MDCRKNAVAVALLVSAGWWFTASSAEPPYVGDPDENRPTLHVQPPLRSPLQRVQGTNVPASVINGITYIDVALSASYDFAGDDWGNEPAITANPLNPNQIVLTSFSGSGWATGGNASLFYSSNGGASWAYLLSVPPPPGTTTGPKNCPCDQNMDWGRNGLLYGTFLNVAGTVQTVFSAQATNPADPSSWVYRAPGGSAQSTGLPALNYTDQPWLWSGPLPGDNSQTNVCVAYDNFDSGTAYSEIRVADSPGASPLDFTRDAATNTDSLQYNDGMNPGNRIAVGPDGTIFNVFQRLVSSQSGVKKLTYLITVSNDGGTTWSVTNSDHLSGARIIAADVYSFQGNGSKVGGVNALLGGIDAIAADPKTGAAWVVYGARATLTGHDQLYLVKVTFSAGDLTIGTPVLLTSSTIDNYLPSVAVLPNGEVGVLFLTLSGSTFTWRFAQYTNGITIVKTTDFPSFTSPFTNNGQANQRILGDYVQVRAVGCTFYGAYPARGSGVNSVNSIDPYFMSAPAAGTCALPTLTGLLPATTCGAGGSGFNLTLQGTGFANGATGRIQGTMRPTTYNSPTQVTMAIEAADVAVAGVATIELFGALPAGGLTGGLPLTVLATPAAPTASNSGPICAGATLNLSASPVAGATYTWTGPNSFNSTLQNPALSGATTAAVGTYTVTATVGSCTSSAAATSAAVLADGGACDDGNPCTAVDTCGGGVCLGVLPSAAPGSTPDLTAQNATTLMWPPLFNAAGYDVVRGDLGLLRSSGGNFQTSTTECLANDQSATTRAYAGAPAPGGGIFFLVRGENCSGSGTYDTGSPKQVASRDAEVDAAPITCALGTCPCWPGGPQDIAALHAATHPSTSCSIASQADSPTRSFTALFSYNGAAHDEFATQVFTGYFGRPVGQNYCQSYGSCYVQGTVDQCPPFGCYDRTPCDSGNWNPPPDVDMPITPGESAECIHAFQAAKLLIPGCN